MREKQMILPGATSSAGFQPATGIWGKMPRAAGRMPALLHGRMTETKNSSAGFQPANAGILPAKRKDILGQDARPTGFYAAKVQRGFTLPDLLVVIAIVFAIAALAVPKMVKSNAKTKQAQCVRNLKEITRAVLLYADDNHGTLPLLDPSPPTGVWWRYKELVKGHLGLVGKSSPRDKAFA